MYVAAVLHGQDTSAGQGGAPPQAPANLPTRHTLALRGNTGAGVGARPAAMSDKPATNQPLLNEINAGSAKGGLRKTSTAEKVWKPSADDLATDKKENAN
ncbi:hypothetical protein H696_04418 [Fonticula alba]|uniref:Uncharacterized protein n=1 Tax=Fonticula alba TaxID=691883 RepID=A0A058Z519_FONAL|nr:hypothetical protein H696_04418 [Fonticula alba]KCV68998.1 hypothetical protein H696_04418 [Fonticula alba]|eukprot:XP_009496569.1 hypothetical protein H696_04418 [Fonticula alba]